MILLLLIGLIKNEFDIKNVNTFFKERIQVLINHIVRPSTTEHLTLSA